MLWLELDAVLDTVLDTVLDMVLDKVLDAVLDAVMDTVLDTVLDVLKGLDIVLLGLVVAGRVEEVAEAKTPVVQPVSEIEIVSMIRVTPPVRAYRPPWLVTSVSTEMLAIAIKSPAKAVPVPSVALLPTAQVIPQGWAPLSRVTADLVAVVKVEPIWNTH